MKFDEYILEELSFHKWKLKSGFEFKKNKVVKVKVKNSVQKKHLFYSLYPWLLDSILRKKIQLKF